jgi:tricorn protease-like protein
LIYTVPVAGGAPKRLTEQGPSYFHGWSPDGKTLTYCAERNGNFDVYTISVDGGPEKRLTTAEGKDDGPEFSPDGQYIYFNSERNGGTQIWRMKADGSEQEQVPTTIRKTGFPLAERPPAGVPHHEKGAGIIREQVALRIMDLKMGKVDVLATLSAARARSTCRPGRPTVSTWRLSVTR